MRVAVVGLGEAGRDIHLPALRGLEGIEVVAGCDSDGERRALVADRWGVPCYADFDRMMAAETPDVVIVATPPASHCELAVRSLEAGSHVVCEKPFVTSLEEADRVIAAGEAAGRGVAVNHEFRAMPIFRALLGAVGDSASGPLRFAQTWQLMNRPPWEEPGWRGRLTHRTLFEAGVHLVDYLLALFGDVPSTVSATASSCGAGDRIDAVALVTLEFPSGGVAQLTQSRLSPGESMYFEVRADTRDASFRASYGGRARLSAGLCRSKRPHLRAEFGLSGVAWKEVRGRRSFIARNPADALVRATADVLRESIEAFGRGADPPVPGATARQVLAVITAAYASAAEGRRIELGRDMTGLQGVRLGIAEGTP